MNEENYERVCAFIKQNKIDADPDVLFTALCHSSYANEVSQTNEVDIQSNERLEFLGDAVLDCSLADILYNYFELTEGEMSKIRAMVGSEVVLSKVSEDLCVGEFLFLGKGEIASGGAERPSILADAFEAILAAIYLSKGFKISKKFVFNHLFKYISLAVEGELFLDYKTSLQELTQAEYGSRPIYELVGSYGPPQERIFKVKVLINEKEMGIGTGRTKKSAEQMAAHRAIDSLKKKGVETIND
jgi:ribonuclease-3